MYSGDELYGDEITSPTPIDNASFFSQEQADYWINRTKTKAKAVKVTLECMECGMLFKVSDDRIYECECPNCGSTDLELA